MYKDIRLSLDEITEALDHSHVHQVREYLHRNGHDRQPTAIECILYYVEAKYGPRKDKNQGELF